jgi:hypothetical protein
MRLSDLHRRVQAGIFFEPEYKLILEVATSKGYTLPSINQSIKNNKIIKELKEIGIFQKLDLFYYCKQEAGLSDFAKLNWADPNNFELYQNTPALVPSFEPNGGFKGAGKYFFTDYQPFFDAVNIDINNSFLFYKTFDIPADTFGRAIFGGRLSNTIPQIFIVDNILTQTTYRLFVTGNSITTVQENENMHTLISNIKGVSNGYNVYQENTNITSSTVGTTALNFNETELTFMGVNTNGTVEAMATDSGLQYVALGGGVDSNAVRTEIFNIMSQ